MQKVRRDILIQKAFDVLWRLSILALPWQTRWFRTVMLAGWPWEQGRVSVYVSWLLMSLTILFGWKYLRRRLCGPNVSRILIVVAALFVCTVIPVFFHGDFPWRLFAVGMWWIDVLLLIGFSLTLFGARIPWRSISWWFIFSMIPQALLGLVQYATQVVEGSKWFGIATHLAETPGTAVVEFGVWRYLRAYAGFPHPNIFGGWLVVAILSCFLLAGTTESKKRAFCASISSGLFAVALVLTFSRSAWIALVVGFCILFFVCRKRIISTQFFWLSVAAAVIAGGAVGISQRAVVLARSDTASRLEAKSIDERGQSLKDGLAEFRLHPVFGSGPNAELVDLRNLVTPPDLGYSPLEYKTIAPLEPPHNVALLALADCGIIGILLLFGIAWVVLKKSSRLACPFFAALFILGMFDHYLWSTWSGQCLLALVVVLAFAPADEHERGREVERGEVHVHGTKE